MSKYLLILFIPAIYARISVRITTGETKSASSVKYRGTDVGIISDTERETFMIGDDNLKKAVEAFTGGRPDDVFVRSPTPWDDVYHRFKWDQVQRTLKPISSKVLAVHTKLMLVAKKIFKNLSSVKSTYNAAIEQDVEEYVSNSWSTGGQLSVGQAFSYTIDFAAGSIGGRTNLGFNSSWGNDTSTTKSATLGTITSVEVPLEPNQAVVATLSATHGTLDVEVNYEATLSGMVFANYHQEFHGHHFWALPVNEVLKAAGLPDYVNSTEQISVGFYASADVEIRDKGMTSKDAMKLWIIPVGVIKDGSVTKVERPRKKSGDELRGSAYMSEHH